jgi:hypothetical protein
LRAIALLRMPPVDACTISIRLPPACAGGTVGRAGGRSGARRGATLSLVRGNEPAATGITRTGINAATGCAAANAPLRTCVRHVQSWPRETSCRRATNANTAPGASASATIRSLSSNRHRRCRSTPEIISIPNHPPLIMTPKEAPL